MTQDKTKQEMNVYLIDTGVDYHVAGADIRAATIAWLTAAPDFEDMAALEDGFSISMVPRENWPPTYNDSEGSGDTKASFSDLIARTTEAGVLSCSEWP